VGCAVGGLVEDWVTEPDLDFELPLDAGGEDAQARRRVLGGLRQGSLPYTIHADSALRYRHTIRGLVHPLPWRQRHGKASARILHQRSAGLLHFLANRLADGPGCPQLRLSSVRRSRGPSRLSSHPPSTVPQNSIGGCCCNQVGCRKARVVGAGRPTPSPNTAPARIRHPPSDDPASPAGPARPPGVIVQRVVRGTPFYGAATSPAPC